MRYTLKNCLHKNLNCVYTPVLQREGTYFDVFCKLFARSRVLEPASTKAIELIGYDVVKEEYPDKSTLQQATGILITGSGSVA